VENEAGLVLESAAAVDHWFTAPHNRFRQLPGGLTAVSGGVAGVVEVGGALSAPTAAFVWQSTFWCFCIGNLGLPIGKRGDLPSLDGKVLQGKRFNVQGL